jgi:chemotaxis signal transduction protein
MTMSNKDEIGGVVGGLERELKSSRIQDFLENMLTGITEVTDESRAIIFSYYKDRSGSIISSLRDVVMEGDETEALMMLPGIFLELRFKWNRYNAQIQYQTVLKGGADPLLAIKASVISFLMGLIEAQLSGDQVFWVYRIAADPISSVASRGDTVKRLLSLALSAREGHRRTLDCLDELGKMLGSGDDEAATGITLALERAKDDAVANSDHVIVMRPPEIHDILELLVVERLVGRQLRATLHHGNSDGALAVLPEVVLALREVVVLWLERCLGKVSSADASQVDGAAAVTVNLRWSLRAVHTRLFFEIEHDAPGVQMAVNADDLPVKNWSHLRLEASTTDLAGAGGRLSIACEASAFGSFLICSLHAAGGVGDLRIAIVTTSVMSVLPANHKVDTGLGLVRTSDGTLVPIVDLRERWRNLELAPPRDTSVYLILATQTGGFIALRVDEIPGAIRGAILSFPQSTSVNEFVGFVSLKDGLALVLDPERLRSPDLNDRQLQYGT